MKNILVSFCLFNFSIMSFCDANLDTKKKVDVSVKQEKNKQKALSPENLASGIQKKYNSIKSAKLEFEQEYAHPILPNQKSKGIVFFKPKKMLWRYLEPKKEFYINHEKFTYVKPKDKVAYTHNCFKENSMSASIAFLWGKGDIKTSFTISGVNDKSLNKSLNWIQLKPKEANGQAKTIYMGVNKSFDVKETIVIDASNGKNHFKFKSSRINQDINDNMFMYKAKKDIKVQPMPNVSCKKKSPKSND